MQSDGSFIGDDAIYSAAEALYDSRWEGDFGRQDADIIGVYVSEVHVVLRALNIPFREPEVEL